MANKILEKMGLILYDDGTADFDPTVQDSHIMENGNYPDAYTGDGMQIVAVTWLKTNLDGHRIPTENLGRAAGWMIAAVNTAFDVCAAAGIGGVPLSGKNSNRAKTHIAGINAASKASLISMTGTICAIRNGSDNNSPMLYMRNEDRNSYDCHLWQMFTPTLDSAHQSGAATQRFIRDYYMPLGGCKATDMKDVGGLLMSMVPIRIKSEDDPKYRTMRPCLDCVVDLRYPENDPRAMRRWEDIPRDEYEAMTWVSKVYVNLHPELPRVNDVNIPMSDGRNFSVEWCTKNFFGDPDNMTKTAQDETDALWWVWRACLCSSLGYYRNAVFLINATGYQQGNNGKSTVMQVISQMLNSPTDKNFTHTPSVNLHKLGDPIENAKLYDVPVSLTGEVSADVTVPSAACTALKAATSGNDILTAKLLYHDVFSFTSRAVMIYASNGRPVFKDKSDAVGKRILWLPFPKDFARSEGESGIPEVKSIKEDYMKRPETLTYIARKCFFGLPTPATHTALPEWDFLSEEKDKYNSMKSASFIFFSELFDSDYESSCEKYHSDIIQASFAWAIFHDVWCKASGYDYTGSRQTFTNDLIRWTNNSPEWYMPTKRGTDEPQCKSVKVPAGVRVLPEWWLENHQMELATFCTRVNPGHYQSVPFYREGKVITGPVIIRNPEYRKNPEISDDEKGE